MVLSHDVHAEDEVEVSQRSKHEVGAFQKTDGRERVDKHESARNTKIWPIFVHPWVSLYLSKQTLLYYDIMFFCIRKRTFFIFGHSTFGNVSRPNSIAAKKRPLIFACIFWGYLRGV